MTRQGTSEASDVSEVFRQHSQAMVKRASSKLPSVARAEELVQETFVKVLERNRVAEVDSLPAYLNQSLNHQISDEFRYGRSRETPADVSEILDKTPIEDPNELERAVDRKFVRHCMRKLRARERLVLELDSTETPRAEIAKELGLSAHAATVVLGRARESLRRLLLKAGYVPIFAPIRIFGRRARKVFDLFVKNPQFVESLVACLGFIAISTSPSISGLVNGFIGVESAPAVRAMGSEARRFDSEISHLGSSEFNSGDGNNGPPSKKSLVTLAGPETKITVTEQKKTGPEEPPLTEQLLDLVADPSRVSLPRCPETLNC